MDNQSTRMSFHVNAKTNFKEECTATNVKIYVPVPNDVMQPKFKSSTGIIFNFVEKSYYKSKILQKFRKSKI